MQKNKQNKKTTHCDVTDSTGTSSCAYIRLVMSLFHPPSPLCSTFCPLLKADHGFLKCTLPPQQCSSFSGTSIPSTAHQHNHTGSTWHSKALLCSWMLSSIRRKTHFATSKNSKQQQQNQQITMDLLQQLK